MAAPQAPQEAREPRGHSHRMSDMQARVAGTCQSRPTRRDAPMDQQTIHRITVRGPPGLCAGIPLAASPRRRTNREHTRPGTDKQATASRLTPRRPDLRKVLPSCRDQPVRVRSFILARAPISRSVPRQTTAWPRNRSTSPMDSAAGGSPAVTRSGDRRGSAVCRQAACRHRPPHVRHGHGALTAASRQGARG
ncbi:MAG: hypothetical protein RLZZ326_659 [Planctomycetota bacterium]